MRARLIFCAALFAVLPACGSIGPSVPDDEFASLCPQINQRAPGRPLTGLLAEECWKVARALSNPADPIAARYALSLHRHLLEHEQVVADLGGVVTRSGEYLIARENGTLEALRHWLTVQQRM